MVGVEAFRSIFPLREYHTQGVKYLSQSHRLALRSTDAIGMSSTDWAQADDKTMMLLMIMMIVVIMLNTDLVERSEKEREYVWDIRQIVL